MDRAVRRGWLDYFDCLCERSGDGGRRGPLHGSDRLRYTEAINLLIVCTGNVCRSPMAAGFLRHRLERLGVSAAVASAGLLDETEDAPPSAGAVKAVASWGIDITGHRARVLGPAMVRDAELVIGMAREHVREASIMVPGAWSRVFTLKELVRRGDAVGPRGAHERLDDWLGRLAEGRDPAALMGTSPEDDIADPIGLSDAAYEATAKELESLIDQVVELVWGARAAAAIPAASAASTHDQDQDQDQEGAFVMTSTGAPAGIDPLRDADPEVADLIAAEVHRQASTLQLIASENFASAAVLAAAGTVLTNKYSEGYPYKRYYGGNRVIDEVEDLARTRLCNLLGATHANVQPHSGANANAATYLALLQPGDTVLAMRLDQGGHLTHGSPVNFSGRLYKFVAYGVSASDERIDLDQVRDLALAERPKLIVAGATAYPRIIDPAPLRAIADEVGALFMFDAAHVAGLIAGGVYPTPVGVADVVTFTTHKTLRGPRGGAIVCGEELAGAIDKSVFPGLQGGPLEHIIAAKAVCFAEAARPSFGTYAAQVVANAGALAAGLAAEGFRLVSGGTDTHLLLIDLRSFDPELTGRAAQDVLDRAGITCNRNQIPGDPRSPFVTSGLRLGSAAATTAGMREPEMAEIARLIGETLRRRDSDAEVAAIAGEVGVLCSKFPPPS